MNISRHRLKQAAFWLLLVAGVGLCIGGIFYAPLIAVGVACVGAASAVRERPQEQRQNEEANHQIYDSEQNIAVDFGNHNNLLILRNAPCPEYRLAHQQNEQTERPADNEASVTIHEKPPF